MVKVKPGSSVLEAVLDSPLCKFAEGVINKMDGNQLLIAILGSAALYAGTVCFKAYLQNQKEIKNSDMLLSMSDKETERLQIFSDAVKKSPQLEGIKTDAEFAFNSILKGAAEAETAQIGGVTLGKKEVVEVLRSVRTRSSEVQLNGEYKILAIDSTKPDHYKVELQFKNGQTFQARLDDQCLMTRDQNRIFIENALWERTSIYLLVNATELRGEITKATIVDVRDRFMKGMHDL